MTWLPLTTRTFLILLVISHATFACDYTIRDIGFIRRDVRPLKLLVYVPNEDSASNLAQELSARFSSWNFELTPVRSDDPRIRAKLATNSELGVWLECVDGRVIECIRGVASEELEGQLMQRLESKLTKAIRNQALSSFAQVIVFSRIEDGREELLQEVQTAVEAAKRLNALQPKPNLLPINIHQVFEAQAESEKLALGAIGIDWQSSEPALAVVYGRGLLAGPTIETSANSVRELLSQLSLVGASCECGTSRQWTRQNVMPLEWTKANADDSQHYLKFDPDSNLVRTEVARILGQRTGRITLPGNGVDPISHLVESYLDSELPEYANNENTPDDATASTVKATVLQGEGWGFEAEETKPAIVAIPPGRTIDGRASDPESLDSSANASDRSERDASAAEEARGNPLPTSMFGRGLVLCIGIVAILFFIGLFRFAATRNAKWN